MLKFKTGVPKCQGVKLLKYKSGFNIPKHYENGLTANRSNNVDHLR